MSCSKSQTESTQTCWTDVAKAAETGWTGQAIIRCAEVPDDPTEDPNPPPTIVIEVEICWLTDKIVVYTIDQDGVSVDFDAASGDPLATGWSALITGTVNGTPFTDLAPDESRWVTGLRLEFEWENTTPPIDSPDRLSNLTSCTIAYDGTGSVPLEGGGTLESFSETFTTITECGQG